MFTPDGEAQTGLLNLYFYIQDKHMYFKVLLLLSIRYTDAFHEALITVE